MARRRGRRRSRYEYTGFRDYVPIATRHSHGLVELKRRGIEAKPVRVEGTRIAQTFWGKAWCAHLEKLGDYANRLPRGRTYLRNGSVCHMEITEGRIVSIVTGSAPYDVSVSVTKLAKRRWDRIRGSCADRIGSLVELLEGRLSDHVMRVITDATEGMFPSAREIDFSCSCPDYAGMCKHVAAVLYGVGARLDAEPSLFFLLRGVDQHELISGAAASVTAQAGRTGQRRRIAQKDLEDVFGIVLSRKAPSVVPTRQQSKPARIERTPAKPGKPNPQRASRARTGTTSARRKKPSAKANGRRVPAG